MGLVGLTKTCAIEGGKNNILCNVIVPMAASRLTEDVFLPGNLIVKFEYGYYKTVKVYAPPICCQNKALSKVKSSLFD